MVFAFASKGRSARLTWEAALPWLPGLLLFGSCVALTWATAYVTHDADSRLYAALTTELAVRPVVQWLAPEWGGHWGRQGLFLEHPPGMFWAGAVLVRLGLPGMVALYSLNFASWLGAVALLWRLGCHLACRQTALLAVLLWCACPAFVQYLVRGDQEHPLTFACLLALVAVTARTSLWAAVPLWALANALALFCKGLPAFALLPLAFGLGLAQHRCPMWWCAMGLGTTVAGLGAWAFEQAYVAQTGQSFWRCYATEQVAFSVGQAWLWSNKAANLLYYVARPMWFAAPGIVVGGWAVWRRYAYGQRLGGIAWGLGLGMLALFIGAFALADRKADRYLFAAYPVLCLAAARAAVLQGGRLQRLAGALLTRPQALMWRGAGVLGLAVLIKIYVGTYHYVFVRFWPGG